MFRRERDASVQAEVGLVFGREWACLCDGEIRHVQVAYVRGAYVGTPMLRREGGRLCSDETGRLC